MLKLHGFVVITEAWHTHFAHLASFSFVCLRHRTKISVSHCWCEYNMLFLSAMGNGIHVFALTRLLIFCCDHLPVKCEIRFHCMDCILRCGLQCMLNWCLTLQRTTITEIVLYIETDNYTFEYLQLDLKLHNYIRRFVWSYYNSWILETTHIISVFTSVNS